MWYAVDLVLIAVVVGGISIWLVDRTNKKGYAANDWEIFRIVLAVVFLIGIAIAFALFGL